VRVDVTLLILITIMIIMISINSSAQVMLPILLHNAQAHGVIGIQHAVQVQKVSA